jgi:extradiol dioxygenase family protein
MSSEQASAESGMHSLNHTAMPVIDMDAAEIFYCDVLGATHHNNTCFTYEDVKTGTAIFKSFIIGDFLLALTVARNPMEMPPAEQFRGAHGYRHGFQISRAHFGEIKSSLEAHGVPYEGPVLHPQAGPFGESLYFKDPSGNFLEFVWRRDEDALPKNRTYLSPE